MSAQAESKRGHDLNITLFERLATSGYPCVTLRTQHRIHPQISAILKTFYPTLLDADAATELPPLRGVQHSALLIAHEYHEGHPEAVGLAQARSHSKVNPAEACMVVDILRYLLKQGYPAERIKILTTYSAQLDILRSTLRDAGIQVQIGESGAHDPQSSLGSVRLSTVGGPWHQADIVIVSLVRSNASHQLGHLQQPQLVTELLSHARFGLILLGNKTTLRRGSAQTGLWDTVLRALPVCQGFPARCEVHGRTELVHVGEFSRLVRRGSCHPACAAELGGGLEGGYACSATCYADVTVFEVRIHVLCTLGMHVRLGHQTCQAACLLTSLAQQAI